MRRRAEARGRRGGFPGSAPLGCWCDNTDELLAAMLRPGSAGSNTAADHLAVLGEAIAALRESAVDC